MLAALGITLAALVAHGDDSLALGVVRGLSAGNLGALVPIAADARQLYERDFISVVRVFDHQGCVDIRSFSSAAVGDHEIRVDVDAQPGVPATWYATVVDTPNGPRIESLDDAPTRMAKRLFAAKHAEERKQILAEGDATFGSVIEAFASLELFNAAERTRAEVAANDLLDLATARGDTIAMARLLTTLAAIAEGNHDEKTAVRLAETALRVLPFDAPEPVFNAARYVIADTASDKDLWHCAVEEAVESKDIEVATLAFNTLLVRNSNDMDFRSLLMSARRCRERAETTGNLGPLHIADLYLGTTQNALHKEPEAIETLGRAVATARRMHDSRSVGWGLFWQSVALGRVGPDPIAAAAEALRQAKEAAPPQADTLQAFITNKLGALLVKLHRLDEAEKLAAHPPEFQNDIARRNFQAFVSDLRWEQGRYQDVIDSDRQAIRFGGTTSLWMIWAFHDRIASCLMRLGHPDEADAEWETSIAMVEKRKAITGTTPDTSARYMVDKQPVYTRYAAALVARNRAADALKIVERGRSYLLTEAMGGRALPPANLRDARELHLNVRLDELNRQRLAATNDARIAAIERERDSVRHALDLVRVETAAEHPDEQAVPEWTNVLDLDAVLTDARTALIEYVITDAELDIFVISREGVSVHRVTTNPAELSRTVTAFRQAIAERDLDYRAKAGALERMLLAPIDAALRRYPRLYLIPDGVLWRVPFQVLRDRSGKMLIERHTISYAPSLAMLRAATAQETKRRPADHVLLALGNPRTGDAMAKSVAAKYRGLTFGNLPDAAAEVRALRKMYGSRATVLTGGGADETTAKRLAPSYRILHFATHGVIDDAQAMYSALVLAPSSQIGDDGLLEAREVAQLHLNADLAVLSACDTAEGEIYPGQGVIGMSWAFLIAGCPTTVVTHWKASSPAARELMVSFHRHLLAGHSAAASLRLAELEMRQKPAYAHPYYWANFFVTGLGMRATAR